MKENCDSNWIYEDIGVNSSVNKCLSNGIFGKTLIKDGNIEVIESNGLGKSLYLDNSLQFCEFDEFIYHEMIVHPSITSLKGSNKKILIIGGGDGGTLREVLKHESKIKKIDFCDISKKIIDISSKYLNTNLKNNLLNKKVNLIINDGAIFVKKSSEKYDLIIIDAPDPKGEALSLFDFLFFKDCKRILKKNGILTFQSQSYFSAPKFVDKMRFFMSQLFSNSYYYNVSVPTFPIGNIGFIINRDFKIKPKNVLDTKFYNIKIFESCKELPQFFNKNNRFENFCKLFDLYKKNLDNRFNKHEINFIQRISEIKEPEDVYSINIPLFSTRLSKYNNAINFDSIMCLNIMDEFELNPLKDLKLKVIESNNINIDKYKHLNLAGFIWDNYFIHVAFFIPRKEILEEYEPEIFNNKPECHNECILFLTYDKNGVNIDKYCWFFDINQTYECGENSIINIYTKNITKTAFFNKLINKDICIFEKLPCFYSNLKFNSCANYSVDINLSHAKL